MLKKLTGSIREFKRPAIMSVLFILFEAGVETAIPFITAMLVNNIKAGVDMKSLLLTGVVLFIMAFVSLTCGGVAGVAAAKASTGFSKNLRHDMFSNIQKYSFDNIDKFSTASLVTRMTTDVNNIQLSFMMIIRIAIRAPLMIMFSVIMGFAMGGAMALIFVVIIPIMGLGLFFIAKKAMPAFRRVFKKYDRLNESIEENVRAMRVVKGFAREDYEKHKFDLAADDIRGDFTHAERIVNLNMPLLQICMNAISVCVLFIGARFVISSKGADLDIGQISALITYGVQILMSLLMLTMVFVMITMSAESARRIVEVIDEKSTLSDIDDPVTEVKDGSVDFENVNFKYSLKAKNYSLSGVDLHISSGMTVGILGGTGSAKSSLVQLIPRLYDATEGVVKVGGIDVRNYKLSVLRDAVAMVLQKNLLFSRTIKENLLWGNENASDEEIKEACRLAQADEFINAFPEGYDTYIEQGGSNVSGGQKQRLCIARALLKKPKILILDDSTSAVDTKTDSLIREGFRRFIPETTKIIIAQRIASVQDADLIIIMDNGRISAVGNHESLMADNEVYRETYMQQTKGGDEDEI